MGSVINTNTLSLLTQNNLNKSQSALNTSIQRLSSGLRINSAKDDAAGQAIANRFTANIKGLSQATRNANDGISLAQTTEGALNEVNTNLQRIRELTVQSANASNSDFDKASIQAEITQRLDEINRTSAQTDFNGVKVLSSSAVKLDIQIGANDGEVIGIDLKEISQKTLGLTGFDAGNTLLAANLGTALTSGVNFDVSKTAAVAANSFAPTAGPAMAADGVYKLNAPAAFGPPVLFSGAADALTAAEAVTTGASARIVSYTDGTTTKYAAVDSVDTSGKAAALTAAQITDGSVTDIVSYIDGGVQKYAAVDVVGTATAGVAVTLDASGVFTAGAALAAGDITALNAGGPVTAVDGEEVATMAVAVTVSASGVFTAGADISADVGKINASDAAVDDGDTFTAAPTTDYAVKGADGAYYLLGTNAVTSDLTWDSGSAAVAATSVNVAGGTVSTVDIQNTNVPTALTIDNGPIAGGVTITDFSLYKRDDVAAEYLTAADGTGDLTGYAMKASDGKFYGVTLNSTTGGTDAKAWVLTAKVDANAMTEVSSDNVGAAVGSVITSNETVASTDDLKNVATNPGSAPTSLGVFKVTAGGYAVKGSDNSYYAATVATGGAVSWDSSTTALVAGDVDVAGGAVTSVKDGTSAAATFSGLGSDTLHEIMKDNGSGTQVGTGAYVIKGGTTDAPTFKNAILGAASATGVIAVTKGTEATVDPMAMLDRAIAQVDTLRGSLGAVQNRFDSVISNLGSTVTNLSASRSRIEDADYATEVSNMTRAQILQQAGTSVLAKANQSTQGVMALLQ